MSLAIATADAFPSPALSLEWDYTRADRVIRFVETVCRVPEGANVGGALVLRDWQKEFVRSVYRTRGGVRVARRAILSMGRKNGKTALIAALSLAHLCGPEALPNGSIYSSAMSREQAGLLHRLAAKMRALNPALSQALHNRPSSKQLVHITSGTIYTALSAEATTAYGLSPSFNVHDELGQVSGPVSPLYDALETASGAHDEPLSIIISTQAATDEALLSQLIDDAATNPDERTVVKLHTADPDMDLMDRRAWHAANPALGDFLKLATFEETAQRAVRTPSFEPVFRNLHLNQRVAAGQVMLPRAIWDRGNAEPRDHDVSGRPAFAGLDLSSRTDMTSFVVVVPHEDGVVSVFPQFWLPAVGILDREKQDRVPYTLWAREGLLRLCPGPTIDLRWVVDQLLDAVTRFDLRAIKFDRWRIDFLRTLIDAQGASLPLVPHGQGFRDMSPALDELEGLAVSGKLRHGGHPILRWNMSNAVVTVDPAGNRKLDKKRSVARIDGAVALAMALAGMTAESESTGEITEAPIMVW